MVAAPLAIIARLFQIAVMELTQVEGPASRISEDQGACRSMTAGFSCSVICDRDESGVH